MNEEVVKHFHRPVRIASDRVDDGLLIRKPALVTPSPAQGAFGSRTPGLPKTPLAAKEARRRLNLDSLAAAGGSPKITIPGRSSNSRETGLGMELGGELVS